MKLKQEITIYQNPDPLLVSRQAVFPGIVELPGGDLLAIFSIGQAFDSADTRAFVSKSVDHGQNWCEPYPLHGHVWQPNELSESFKPLLLADGTLLATGYGFVRPDALTPIVDPKTFEILELRNLVSASHDNGQTWDEPNVFNIGGMPLELSGLCIQLASGRIIGACAPFNLGENGHSGWIIFSDDGGKSWDKLSEFFKAPNGQIAPWECRLCEMEPGQVAVLFWAYDTRNKCNLNNHIVYSSDGGVTFEAALDTGVRAQASNLLWLGDHRILTIHAHRENPVGLWVRIVDVSDGGFQITHEICLFSDDDMGSDTKDIRKQFASLKFGQPSVIRMQNDQILAACWAFENSQHVIKGYFIEI